MERFYFIIFLVLANLNSHSQEVKKVINKIKYNTSEIYYVLKSDKNVKHGKYFMLSYIDTLQSGYYTNNLKTGNWRYFKGNNLEFIYNYDIRQITTDTLGKERPALYSEGFDFFKHLSVFNLIYPREAVEAGHSGKVVISFSIKADGSVSDFELYKGCGDISLYNEALRVTKMGALQNTWFPAINSEGEKINSTMTNTIIFVI